MKNLQPGDIVSTLGAHGQRCLSVYMHISPENPDEELVLTCGSGLGTAHGRLLQVLCDPESVTAVYPGALHGAALLTLLGEAHVTRHNAQSLLDAVTSTETEIEKAESRLFALRDRLRRITSERDIEIERFRGLRETLLSNYEQSEIIESMLEAHGLSEITEPLG